MNSYSGRLVGDGMNILFELFFTFAKIGLFTFGGGLAMIPIVENTCVNNKKWITHEEMMNITVIAESTPGPIAINCATFVGYKKKGILGAIASTIGVVLPSFLIIYLIAFALDNFLEITIVANAFRGIKLAVGILILDVAINMIKKMKKRLVPMVLMITSVIMMLIVNIFAVDFSSITLMLFSGLISFVIFMINSNHKKAGEIK